MRLPRSYAPSQKTSTPAQKFVHIVPPFSFPTLRVGMPSGRSAFPRPVHPHSTARCNSATAPSLPYAPGSPDYRDWNRAAGASSHDFGSTADAPLVAAWLRSVLRLSALTERQALQPRVKGLGGACESGLCRYAFSRVLGRER